MFDPYRKWLSIPEEYRPPSHYQLLGIDPRELDREVIEAAVIRQSAYIRNFQKGPNAEAATQILNEIAAAKICLLDAAKRAAYDATLKPVASAPVAAVPVAVPVTAKPPQAKAASNPAAALRPRPGANAGRPKDDRLEQAVRAVSADPLGPAVRSRPPLPLKLIAGGAAAAIVLVLLIVLTSGRSAPEATPIAADGSESKIAAETLPVVAESSANSVREKAPENRPKLDSPESPISSGSAKSSEAPTPPTEPKGSPVAVVSAPLVDLLSLIRLPENAVVGDWKLENGELLSPNLDSSARLQIPYVPPSDYRLTVSGRRAGEQGDLVLGLVMAGRQFTVALDAGVDGQFFCGIGLIDGKGSDVNGTRQYIAKVLGDNQAYVVVYEVHPGSVTVKVNGRVLLNWSGDPARLSLLEYFRMPRNDELFLLAHSASHCIRQIELEVLPAEPKTDLASKNDPAPAEAQPIPLGASKPERGAAKPTPIVGNSVDLLSLIDPAKHAVQGKWVITDGALISPNGKAVRVQIPFVPPADYQLKLVGTRLEGADLWVGLVMAGRQFQVTIDGEGRTHSSVANATNASSIGRENLSKKIDNVLGQSRGYTVVCEVHPGKLRVTVNNALLLEWSGNPEELRGADMPNRDQLWLGSWESVHRIRQIELRPLPLADTLEQDASKSQRPDSDEDNKSLYLSTLKPVETHIMAGGTLNQLVSLNGVKSPHGIYSHPDGHAGSRVVYVLPQIYQSINGKVAINDTSPGAESPLTFRIVVNGRTIWKSKPIQSKRQFEDFDVKLPPSKRIELVVDCPGGTRYAHSVWIEPQVSGPVAARTKKSGASADSKSGRDPGKE